MHSYPSDISREQFEIIREELEHSRRKTKPRKYDLYDIFCGILYVLRGGIQWRMLPSDFPNWQIVYYYFTVWSEADEDGISRLDRVLKKSAQMIRNESLKKDKTTLGIIDSKSIKNVDTAEEKGYDAGKKVSGIKLHNDWLFFKLMFLGNFSGLNVLFKPAFYIISNGISWKEDEKLLISSSWTLVRNPSECFAFSSNPVIYITIYVGILNIFTG